MEQPIIQCRFIKDYSDKFIILAIIMLQWMFFCRELLKTQLSIATNRREVRLLICLIINFVFFCQIQLFSNDIELPSGYRFPVESDYPEDVVAWLKGNLPFRVNSDLDGDGIKDTALLLIKSDKKESILIIYLQSKVNSPKQFVLDRYIVKSSFLNMGISAIQPGNYKTACGKGYWQCKDIETPLLKLEQTGIGYFQFESASSIFYWDPNSQNFERIWMSG